MNLNDPPVRYLISKLDFVVNSLSAVSSLPGINSGSFTYNADDQLSSETYNDANRKTNETDALGHATTYTYDAINQLVTRATPALTILPVSALQDESQLEPTAQCAH
jgi:YD repeat-containing protein